jgi:tripartite-type tricarboxylate transporter receptor subunit TctC
MTPSRRDLAGAAAALSLACGPGARLAFAAGPGPIKVVIAFPPGGTSTASMQPIMPFLARSLDADIALEYMPGSGGDLAAFAVAKAAPDGRTLLFGHAGPLSINPHLLQQSFFDPAKDLVPVAQVIAFPIVLCAHDKLNVRDLDGLIAAGTSRALVTGSSGNGSMQHLAGEVLRRAVGIQTLHIPFAGGGPLQEALVKGALDIVCETGSNVVKHIQEERLVPIAVMAEQRLATLPHVPTFVELGRADLVIDAWFGLVAPAGTPPDVLGRIEAATLQALREPSVATAYDAIGGIPAPLGQTAFAARIAAETARWRDTIASARISPLGTQTGLPDRR